MDTEKAETLGGLRQFGKNNSGIGFLFGPQSLFITRLNRGEDERQVKHTGVALHLDDIHGCLQQVIRLITFALLPIVQKGLVQILEPVWW